jgi:hypothetical protein
MSASRRIVVAFGMAAIVLSIAGAVSTGRAQVPQHIWSQRFGDLVVEQGSVAADGSGNVIMTGDFLGTVDFGGGPLTSTNSDIFVAKFDVDGNHLWSKRFGSDGTQWGIGVAVDASANVVVIGRFWNTVDFGGGPLTSAGSWDMFIAKFDSDGNHLWSKRFGNEDEQYIDCVTVDDSGNVIVTGGIFGTVDFGGGPLTSAGSYDIFVAKFDGDGNHVWSQRFGGVGSEGGASLAVDGEGKVTVTGGFQDTVDFGGGPLTSAGSWDIFVAQFNGTGNHLWSQRFGDASWQGSSCVAVDGSENVIVTGDFWGTVDFGGGTLTSAGLDDIYVVKFDGDGNHVWSRRFGGVGYDGYGHSSVAVDSAESVIVTGGFQGTVDFGGGPLSSAGDWDIFVAQYDGTGNHLWSQRFGDASGQEGNCVAVDGSGNVIVTGDFQGTVDFGGGPLVSTGEVDLFVAKFGSEPTGITDIVIPETFALRQNVPNPFNPTTVIQYDVPETGAQVTLLIYDVAGRLVRTLVDGRKEAGTKRVTWNGDDDRGSRVASGVYFYRMTAPGFEVTKKMVLIQ